MTAKPWQGRLWVDGVVPYRFAPNTGNKLRTTFNDAFTAIQKVSSVRFVPYVSQPDFLTVRLGPVGQSSIGRVGKEQSIALLGGAPLRVVLHELLHALGLLHEHTRLDRDEHVTVHPENAVDDPSRELLLVLEARLDGARPYDFGSVMHYAGNAFAKPGTITLAPKQQLPAGVTLGKPSGLSKGDIESLKILYG